MASAITLGSSPPRKRRSRTRSPLGAAPAVGTCKCSYNPRTKRQVQSCYIGKGARTRKGKVSRSGWEFSGGTCGR